MYDVDVSPAVAAQALVCLLYLAKLFAESGNREAILRYGIPAFANMTGFCAVNEYKLLSGNNSREMALSILLITYFFEVCNFIRSRLNKNCIKGILLTGTMTVGGLWIYVLGDKPREEYLKAFREEDFRYAATMKEEYTLWEFWVQRANWFFYRELYGNWHPVYANTYEMYWERNGREDNRAGSGCSISVEDMDDDAKKIAVRTDRDINGIADLYVEYHVQKNGGLGSWLLLQSMVRVQNTGTVYAVGSEWYESNYLRPSGGEYIPVPVTDGYGEVVLSSCPEGDTSLEIHETSCRDIFTVTFDYVEVQDIAAIGGETAFCVKRVPRAEKAVENARYAVVDGSAYGIDEIKSDDDYLYLLLTDESMVTGREGKLPGGGNMIRIVR